MNRLPVNHPVKQLPVTRLPMTHFLVLLDSSAPSSLCGHDLPEEQLTTVDALVTCSPCARRLAALRERVTSEEPAAVAVPSLAR